MSAKFPKNEAEELKLENTVIAVLPGLLGSGTIPVGGKKLTFDQIKAVLLGHVTSVSTAEANEAAFHTAVATKRGASDEASSVVTAVRDWAALSYGDTSTEYVTLGFPAASRKKPSTATAAVAAEKRLATRQAHHIQGPRQRAAEHTPAATAPAPASVAPAPNSPTKG
jgi:hypothetical protein